MTRLAMTLVRSERTVPEASYISSDREGVMVLTMTPFTDGIFIASSPGFSPHPSNKLPDIAMHARKQSICRELPRFSLKRFILSSPPILISLRLFFSARVLSGSNLSRNKG
jgi:hypothetical protein